MYAEREVEEGTLKWLSRDPCPWTSEDDEATISVAEVERT